MLKIDFCKTIQLILSLQYFHLFSAPMPEEYRNLPKAKPRGVSNRNRGLEWLRANATDGVFYFADDDNTYDLTIFEQVNYLHKLDCYKVLIGSSKLIKNSAL